jgi:hypothetical protein
MAQVNPRWGYLRIVGECRKLGILLSATSVRRILRRHRLGPAPRRRGPSWTAFLRAHPVDHCERRPTRHQLQQQVVQAGDECGMPSTVRPLLVLAMVLPYHRNATEAHPRRRVGPVMEDRGSAGR